MLFLPLQVHLSSAPLQCTSPSAPLQCTTRYTTTRPIPRRPPNPQRPLTSAPNHTPAPQHHTTAPHHLTKKPAKKTTTSLLHNHKHHSLHLLGQATQVLHPSPSSQSYTPAICNAQSSPSLFIYENMGTRDPHPSSKPICGFTRIKGMGKAQKDPGVTWVHVILTASPTSVPAVTGPKVRIAIQFLGCFT